MSKIKIFKGYWSVDDVKKNRRWLFVYGDNDDHYGRGGQAIIRNERNTVGIPTKKHPNNKPDAFYSDNELIQNQNKILDAIEKVKKMVVHYESIILPEDGLGTGLAQLPNKAPKTYKFLCEQIQILKETL